MENEEEKPKKKVRGPGKRRMKLKNGKKHEVLVRKKHSNVETGLSKYQLAKREEFLKVREGETHEQYVIRTKNYRVLTPEDQAIIDNSFSGKLRKKKEEARKLKLRHYFSSQELSQVNQREFYELKYLQIVLRYCGIKFGMTSRDLKLALFFYDNRPFTREEFNYIASLQLEKQVAIFKHFLDKGYIRKVIKTIVGKKGGETVKDTGKYMLSNQMVARITKFYKTFNEIQKLDKNEITEDLMIAEIQTIINTIEREAKQIKSGKKNADTIVPTDNN